KPLKDRENYILTRNESFKAGGAKVIHSVEDILELSKYNELFVIGGGEVYKQLIPHADKMIITHVHEVNFSARIFFPDFTHEEWKVDSLEKIEETEKFPSFTFATYIRKQTN